MGPRWGKLVSPGAPWHKAGVSTSDDAYWNQFYSHRQVEIEVPSSFAQQVIGQIRSSARLFELGCGNGRDALFFASRGLQVVACDRSQVAVETLRARPELAAFPHRPEFVQADFAELPSLYQGPSHDVVYSRFTLHAVPSSVQSAALSWARGALSAGGTLFIEARSVKGSLYGKGEPVERDAFVHDGHYRRFLRLDELLGELTSLGFSIASAVEQAGVAVYREDDPVVLRVAATVP